MVLRTGMFKWICAGARARAPKLIQQGEGSAVCVLKLLACGQALTKVAQRLPTEVVQP